MTISPAWGVRGCSTAVERVKKLAWWLHTGWPTCAGGATGLNTSSFPRSPHKKKLAIGGDIELVHQYPQKLLELRVSGGVEVGGVEDDTRVFFVGSPLRGQGPLHSFAGGGGVVAGGAHHDKDLPLVEEEFIPPLNPGLPQNRSRLNIHAVLWGKGHKSGEVTICLRIVGRGKDMGGGGDVCVG